MYSKYFGKVLDCDKSKLKDRIFLHLFRSKMGFNLEHNSTLRLSESQMSTMIMAEGTTFELTKEGERLYPINIPFEFCNQDYKYMGKLVIKKISIEKDKTTLQGEIVKVFNEQESKIFSDNFIPPDEG